MKNDMSRLRPLVYVPLFAGVLLACSVSLAAEHGAARVSGHHGIFSWERIAGGQVIEAGVAIPMGLFENPPEEPGSGPAGALAVVDFPDMVRDTTCLNHFELQWEKDGHEPPVFRDPHFDFHFYSVPVAEVAAVSQPDPIPPRPELIPAGYVYPGPETTVPQMGVHVFRPADLEVPFTDVLIFGFYGGRMTFIEPMVTRARLLQKAPLSYAIPVPAAAGRITRHPTRFRLTFDETAGVCHLVFSDFVTTSP